MNEEFIFTLETKATSIIDLVIRLLNNPFELYDVYEVDIDEIEIRQRDIIIQLLMELRNNLELAD